MNRVRARILLTFLATAGCAVHEPWTGDPARVDGQDVAEEVVWRGAYGRTEAPPDVLWRRGMTCGSGAFAFPGFRYRGDCATGVMFDDWHAEVATADGFPISRTSYAHELCHAVRLLETGDLDRGHLGGCFADGRDRAAQAALEAALGP